MSYYGVLSNPLTKYNLKDAWVLNPKQQFEMNDINGKKYHSQRTSRLALLNNKNMEYKNNEMAKKVAKYCDLINIMDFVTNDNKCEQPKIFWPGLCLNQHFVVSETNTHHFYFQIKPKCIEKLRMSFIRCVFDFFTFTYGLQKTINQTMIGIWFDQAFMNNQQPQYINLPEKVIIKDEILLDNECTL